MTQNVTCSFCDSWASFLTRLRTTTSSPAVAERPRDASCLPVVSFNSTIPYVERNLLLVRFTAVQINSLLFSSLCRVVHAGCDKQRFTDTFVGILPQRLVQNTRTVWLSEGEKMCRYIYSFRQNTKTWRSDRRTDGQTPNDGICVYAAVYIAA